MTRDDAQSGLLVLTAQMNGDEIEVLTRVALKIVNGTAKHGHMQLDTDTRNWPKEIQDERIDAALYGYMEIIQAERREARTCLGLRELRDSAPIADVPAEFVLASGEG